jgi:hypothetical protein
LRQYVFSHTYQQGRLMNEIVCPHCDKAFKIDEAGYADILKQVRDREFEKSLHDQLELAEKEKNTAIELAKAQVAADLAQQAASKDIEIEKLKAELSGTEMVKQLALNEALGEIVKERDGLARQLEVKSAEQKLLEHSLNEKYEAEIKSKDELIAYYRDFKAKQSTKMVGESLEQHCEIEFNQLRATGFPRAYFEKDNDASTGSKGDYIFRDL